MSEAIQQQEFIRAFRNYFTNADAIKRIIEIAQSELNLKIIRPQATRLLDELWADKKVRNKKHFHEISDKEIAQWMIHFVDENKGQ